MEKVKTHEEKLESIIESERFLNEIQDMDILLERLLSEVRRVTSADAGSIYINEKNILSIKCAQNDSLQRMLEEGQKVPFSFFSFPVNEKSISGYTVLTGELLNIPDVYRIDETKSYRFNRQPDLITGYRSKSMLTVPLITRNKEALGVLQVINRLDDSGAVIPFSEDDELYMRHFAGAAAQALERAKLTRAMVMRMITMAGLRDPKETGAHVNRVSSYAVEIYDRWAFNHAVPYEERHKFRDNLKITAMLHDVGKVGISDSILKLPRIFTPEEYNMIKAHTIIGAMFFSSIESPLDAMSLEVALHHHDRWDGTGYPGKIDMQKVTIDTIPSFINREPLFGEEIPLCARIVSLADVFDALSSKRVYKDAWEDDSVLKEISSQSGKQFDPEVVKAFFEIQPIIRSIKLSLPEE
ncbi:HD domain-containing phosphohydrolase [Treponema sp. HNW]|uniref:GAF and HD-GYP domain-containing protein n=1 Tax=Treponema sp. HNW TaxID=3116654 RepID=UPI003D0E3D2D